jgi:23S rRNA pseudouridine955/2504/2580 synthase
MSAVRILPVSEDDDGARLDRWIKKNAPDLPYVLVQKLMRKGQIRVDGKRAKPDQKLSVGQEVRLPPYEGMRPREEKKISASDIAYIKSLVIFDDGDVIAINKPYDLAVQGGTNTYRHVDGLLEGLANAEGVKPKLVHRLDKDTSGILLLARSTKVARALGDMFKSRDLKKIYWALVSPAPKIYEGTIRAPIAKSSGSNRERMMVDADEGKYSITDYTVIETAGSEAAFVAFWPRTGRTHQIRVHAEYMGCPVLGDPKYAWRDIQHEHEIIDMDSLDLAQRLHLHARRIIFPHPTKKGTLDITAPLPEELAKSWKTLGFDPNYKQDPFAELSS